MLQKTFAQIKNKFLLLGFILLGMLSVFLSSNQESKPIAESMAPDVKSADTFIPKGFVLVPIEIANAESLASLVGDVGGVVDLYLAASENQKGGQKVGSKLKLLRAPLNPQQYAVLVKETQGAQILGHTGPFIAVIQNPDETGNHLNSSAPNRIRIDYLN